MSENESGYNREKFVDLLKQLWSGEITRDEIKNRLGTDEFGAFDVFAAKAFSGDSRVLNKIFDKIYDKNMEQKPEEGRSCAMVENYDYRELTLIEQKILFALYDKHNGNLSAMADDPESLFHSRQQLIHYKHKYGWRNTFERVRATRVINFGKKLRQKLEAAKMAALMEAIKLLSPREMEIALKPGVVASIMHEPHYKEIKTAWEIIKTELGEPTSIAKSENVNRNDDVDKQISELNQILNDAKTAASTTSESNNRDMPVSC